MFHQISQVFQPQSQQWLPLGEDFTVIDEPCSLESKCGVSFSYVLAIDQRCKIKDITAKFV